MQTQTTPSTEQTQTEVKPETKPTDKPAEGAPEAYAEFKAPEGYTLDKAVIDSITPIFKELNLSQDAAQKLVDHHSKLMIDAAKAPMDAYNTIREEWRGEVLKDPVLATAGKLRPEVSSAIAKAIDSVGDAKLSADFRQIMDVTGVGDNPAFVKMLFKWSQAHTEPSHVSGSGPSPHGQTAPGAKPDSMAKALYPNLA